MTRGIDTTFLVQVEVVGSANHEAARRLLLSILNEEGARIALAPQVLAEFIHVVTDPRRFERPLSLDQAVDRARRWWQGEETKQVFPNPYSGRLFLDWMERFHLGRKRLLDTLLAATYFANEVRALITSNPNDFAVFQEFEILSP